MLRSLLTAANYSVSQTHKLPFHWISPLFSVSGRKGPVSDPEAGLEQGGDPAGRSRARSLISVRIQVLRCHWPDPTVPSNMGLIWETKH